MQEQRAGREEILKLVASCTGFEWDEGNRYKNWIKHGVTANECEEIFFNRPLILAEDAQHSKNEARFAAFGRTDGNRLLSAVFMIRSNHIRIITARPMSKKERRANGFETKTNT